MVQEIDLPSHDLEFIPEEIMTRIVECLDWKDVLRIRLTCKRLFYTSTAKSVWAGLIASHQQKAFPSLSVLEKPVEFYTSGELEQLFLHWKRVERAWLKNTSDLEQTRFTPPEPLNQIHLLRGGRWLLCCDCSGEVSYSNLNTGPSELIPLIPALDFPDRPSRVVVMSVDEDWVSPVLSFNIAVCSTLFSTTQGPTFIDIWHGTLVLDDHHKSLGLRAEHLFHLPALSPMLMTACESISLLGSYVAFNSGPTGKEGEASIAIIDWRKSQAELRYSSKSLVYDRTALFLSNTLQLLPNDRILSRGQDISVFDHSQVLEGVSMMNSKLTVPLAHFNDAITHRSTFHSTVCARDDRFICWDDRGVWGLILSKEAALGDQEVTRCSLMKWPLWVLPKSSIKPHFSYNHGLLGGEESLFFVRYAWPGDDDDGELPGISQRGLRGMGLSSSLQMSLFSGKIVCLDNFWRICVSDVL